MQEMPLIQQVVNQMLREDYPDAQVVGWVPDLKKRRYPIINVRRIGGYPVDPTLLDRATIELTVYTLQSEGLDVAENLLKRAQITLWNAVRLQRLTDHGYLHSYRQTMGMTQFDSPYDDTFRVQSLIQLGLRPLP